jgi:hypothetical protein
MYKMAVGATFVWFLCYWNECMWFWILRISVFVAATVGNKNVKNRSHIIVVQIIHFYLLSVPCFVLKLSNCRRIMHHAQIHLNLDEINTIETATFWLIAKNRKVNTQTLKVDGLVDYIILYYIIINNWKTTFCKEIQYPKCCVFYEQIFRISDDEQSTEAHWFWVLHTIFITL